MSYNPIVPAAHVQSCKFYPTKETLPHSGFPAPFPFPRFFLFLSEPCPYMSRRDDVVEAIPQRGFSFATLSRNCKSFFDHPPCNVCPTYFTAANFLSADLVLASPPTSIPFDDLTLRSSATLSCRAFFLTPFFLRTNLPIICAYPGNESWPQYF